VYAAWKKQIAELEALDAEKQKYQLAQIRPGVYAYTPKESASTLEPAHMLCTNCYEERHRSILQEEVRYPGRCHVMVCPRCSMDIYTEGAWQSEHSNRKRRSK
jgi:NMD protein affecting ribosome stability and mRNA decay